MNEKIKIGSIRLFLFLLAVFLLLFLAALLRGINIADDSTPILALAMIVSSLVISIALIVKS